MIHIGWYGAIHKKSGDLALVGETANDAEFDARMIESVKNKIQPIAKYHRIVPVTIIEGNLLDLVVYILDQAKIKLNDRRLEEIAANAVAFKAGGAKETELNDPHTK